MGSPPAAVNRAGRFKNKRCKRSALAPSLQSEPQRPSGGSSKEWAQARGLKLPVYRTVETKGPAHKRHFTVSVSVEGLPDATASGTTKRAAEAAAASSALAGIDAGSGRT